MSRRLLGHLRAHDAHRTADVRIFQRRRVVDAVALSSRPHASLNPAKPSRCAPYVPAKSGRTPQCPPPAAASCFVAESCIQLLPCQRLSLPSVKMPRLSGNGHCRRLVVARDHNRLDPGLDVQVATACFASSRGGSIMPVIPTKTSSCSRASSSCLA